MAVTFLAVSPLVPWLAAVLAAIAGTALGWFIFSVIPGNTLRRARQEAEQINRAATTEAETIRQRAELDAEKRARERRDALEREVAETLSEIRQNQSRLAKREDNLDRKSEKLSDREGKLDQRESESKRIQSDLEKTRKFIDATAEFSVEAADFAVRNKDRKFALWLHYLWPHDPYVKHSEVEDFGDSRSDIYDN